MIFLTIIALNKKKGKNNGFFSKVYAVKKGEKSWLVVVYFEVLYEV